MGQRCFTYASWYRSAIRSTYMLCMYYKQLIVAARRSPRWLQLLATITLGINEALPAHINGIIILLKEQFWQKKWPRIDYTYYHERQETTEGMTYGIF